MPASTQKTPPNPLYNHPIKHLLLAALLLLAPPATAQGYLSRGSGDLRHATQQGTPEDRNLSRWSFWWAFNKAHFCTQSPLARSPSPQDQREPVAAQPPTPWTILAVPSPGNLRLPWHDEYSRHFNYRAGTETLLGLEPLGRLLRP